MAVSLNIIRGLPDDQTVRVSRVRPDGFDFLHNGTAPFLAYVRNDVQLREVWVGPAAPERTEIAPGPFVNHIGDPDICGVALKAALTNVTRLNRPCFNHPKHVFETTRDRVCEKLQGIDGLIVPRTIRLKPTSEADILSALRSEDATGPTLVRVAGTHTGASLTRVENAQHEDALSGLAWTGQELYVTEFHDFADPDGLYRKWRIGVLGGVPFLNHVFVGTSWQVSGDRRLWNETVQAEVEDHFRNFSANVAPVIGPIVGEIYSRLKLDYFGIDCSVKSNGTMMLFEANACMDLLKVTSMISPVVERAKAEIKAALIALLQTPQRWVEQGGLTERQAVATS